MLESWPFSCALSMHLCMVALRLFNKDKVLTHFVDIYHLFTSTEKMHGMLQFHKFSLTW